jgi:hypothetical protein
MITRRGTRSTPLSGCFCVSLLHDFIQTQFGAKAKTTYFVLRDSYVFEKFETHTKKVHYCCRVWIMFQEGDEKS